MLLPGSSGSRLVAAGDLDAGDPAQRLERALPELRLLRRRRIARRRQAHAEREHVIGIETGRLVLQLDEAADRQAGADEQHQRERDLAGDQHRANPPLADAAAAARALFQVAVHVEARELVRRREAEQQARERRDREAEQQHASDRR